MAVGDDQIADLIAILEHSMKLAIGNKRLAIASYLESLSLAESILAIQPNNACKPRVRI